MKKIYFVNALLAVLLLSFTLIFLIACNKKEKQSEEVTLKIIIPWINEELDSFLPVLQAFEEEHPNIKVDYQTVKPEDLSTMLSVQFASQKTPADVIDTSFGWYIREQAKRGHILDLTDVFDTKDYIDGAFNEISYDSKLYGVPNVGGITIGEYRKSYFESKGLGNPSEFDGSIRDFFDNLREKTGLKTVIASGGGVGWTFTSILETFILAAGGKELHNDLRSGNISWTDDKVVSLLTKELLPLIRDGYFGQPDDYEAQLKGMWNGNYAVFFGDSTDSQIISPPTDRGAFLLPGQKTVMLWNDYWFVPKYTEYPEEAKKLIYFLGTEGQEIFVSNGGRIGTYLNIDKSLYPESENEIFNMLDKVSVVPDLDDTIGGKFQATIWDQLQLLWAKPTENTLNNVLERLQEASEETLANR